MHQQKQGIVWSCAMGAGNFESGNVTELYRVADGTDIRKTVVLTGVTFSPQEDVPPLSVVDVDVGAFGNVELSHKMRFADLELRGFHGMYGGQSDVRPLRVAGLISVRDFEGIAGELTIDRVVLRAANGPQAVGGIVRAKKSFVTVSDSIVYGASAVYGGVFFAHDEAMIDVSGLVVDGAAAVAGSVAYLIGGAHATMTNVEVVGAAASFGCIVAVGTADGDGVGDIVLADVVMEDLYCTQEGGGAVYVVEDDVFDEGCRLQIVNETFDGSGIGGRTALCDAPGDDDAVGDCVGGYFRDGGSGGACVQCGVCEPGRLCWKRVVRRRTRCALGVWRRSMG